MTVPSLNASLCFAWCFVIALHSSSITNTGSWSTVSWLSGLSILIQDDLFLFFAYHCTRSCSGLTFTRVRAIYSDVCTFISLQLLVFSFSCIFSLLNLSLWITPVVNLRGFICDICPSTGIVINRGKTICIFTCTCSDIHFQCAVLRLVTLLITKGKSLP